MIWVALFLGCAEAEWTDMEPVLEQRASEAIELKSKRCEQDRIHCEQMCFREYGQTWGTWSITYNACMDQCLEIYEVCTHRPNPIAAHASYARDSSYSWDQPTSDGINGYYGYCGPTAGANLLTNTCGARISPRRISETAFSWTPGTTPKKLVSALNAIEGCGQWAVCHPSPRDADVLGTLERLLPVATLLEWEGALDIHWVTVVDLRRTGSQCNVVYNHWGIQDRMTCNDFISRWSLVDATLGATTVATRALKPFTFVCQTDR